MPSSVFTGPAISPFPTLNAAPVTAGSENGALSRANGPYSPSVIPGPPASPLERRPLSRLSRELRRERHRRGLFLPGPCPLLHFGPDRRQRRDAPRLGAVEPDHGARGRRLDDGAPLS